MSAYVSLICVGLGALLYLALGVFALVMPTRLLRAFGIKVAGVDACNEIRAVYGGLPLAFAGLLCMAMAAPHRAEGIALSVSVATLGMVAGRICSALIDRGMSKIALAAAAAELLAAALIATPLYRF
jgi:hypothetical protein